MRRESCERRSSNTKIFALSINWIWISIEEIRLAIARSLYFVFVDSLLTVIRHLSLTWIHGCALWREFRSSWCVSRRIRSAIVDISSSHPQASTERRVLRLALASSTWFRLKVTECQLKSRNFKYTKSNSPSARLITLMISVYLFSFSVLISSSDSYSAMTESGSSFTGSHVASSSGYPTHLTRYKSCV